MKSCIIYWELLYIAIYYYRDIAIFHEAVGRVKYRTVVEINPIFNGERCAIIEYT